MGYTVKRGANVKHTAVKPPAASGFSGWTAWGTATQRRTFRRVCRRPALARPRRPFPSARPSAPPSNRGHRGGIPGRTRKLKGFRALYFKYLYLLGAIPKRRPKRRFVSRTEIIKFDRYQARL